MRRPALCVALTGLALALAGRDGSGQDRPTRQEMMRTKLDYSRQILEGLTLEDYGRIARGAAALKALSRAAEWEVPTIPNAEQYVVLTAEFQRRADELSRSARDRNLDAATTAFSKLTASCVSCHKYVRSVTR